MKAPLRFAFGWVIFVAIFASLTPILHAIATALQVLPVWLVVVIMTSSLLVFLVFFFLFVRRFFTWCDQPRKTTREVPPCS